MIRICIQQAMLAGLLCVATMAEAQRLKIATLAPNGTPGSQIMQAAAAKIKAATDGRVTIKIYGGGVMGNDVQVIRKIRSGQLQGAAVGTGALARFYGGLELYNLPMVFSDYDEVDYIRNQFDEQIRQGLEEAGFVTFGFAEIGFAYAMSKHRISSVDDARQQKVWVPTDDRSALRALQAFGIAPIPLGLVDVLLALQSGTINAVPSPAHATIFLRWHTQVKYLLNLPLIYTYGMLAVDKKKFFKLNVKDQLTVRNHMGDAFKAIDQANRKDQEAAFAALKNQGIEFVNPTASEVEVWQSLAQEAVAKTVSSGLLSKELYEDMQQRLDVYRAANP